jgi:hypothetical protein
MAKKAAEAMTCEQCRFCVHDKIEGRHVCHFMPPQWVAEEDGNYSRYPAIDPEKDWCGQLKPPLNS